MKRMPIRGIFLGCCASAGKQGAKSIALRAIPAIFLFMPFPRPSCHLTLVTSPFSVAVGTALASGPPHGSVREELPHTALTSGSSDGQPFLRKQLVVRATNPVTRIPGSVSGTSALVVRSPRSTSFPLRTPPPTLPRWLCSPASLVL